MSALPAPAVPPAGASGALAGGVLGSVLAATLLALGVLLVRPQQAADAAAWLVVLALVPAVALVALVRAGQGGSGALLLLAAAIAIVSDATWRSEAGGADVGIDAQSLAKFALWSCGGALALWQRRRLAEALRGGASPWLVALGLWAVLSTAWSPTPVYTLAAALAWLGLWATAAILAGTLAWTVVARALAVSLMFAVAASLLLGVLVPDRALTPMDGGRQLRLSGIFGSPNTLGRAAALLILLAVLGTLGAAAPGVGRARSSRLLLALGLVLGVAALVHSQSRTPVLALAVALAAVLAIQRPRLALAAAAAVVSAAVAAGLVLLVAPQGAGPLVDLLSRSGNAEELTSFTGRTDIWQAAWRLIEQSPWLGHGFASSREVLPAAYGTALGWSTTSAHNLWLQAALTLGAVGLGLLLLATLAWLRAAWRQPHPGREATILFVLVIGLAEASALGPSVNLMSFMLLWAMASTATGAPGSNRRLHD
jgi:O-antigen ligase